MILALPARHSPLTAAQWKRHTHVYELALLLFTQDCLGLWGAWDSREKT